MNSKENYELSTAKIDVEKIGSQFHEGLIKMLSVKDNSHFKLKNLQKRTGKYSEEKYRSQRDVWCMAGSMVNCKKQLNYLYRQHEV